MNFQHNGLPDGGVPPDSRSALSLLVNAADRSERPSQQGGNAGESAFPGGSQRQQQALSLAESLRMRGLGNDPAATLEEQLLFRQQQGRSVYSGGAAAAGIQNILAGGGGIRDPNLLAQLSQQQQHPQLASLLLQNHGGVGMSSDLRAQLLAMQLRQAQQQQQQSGLAGLSNAELLNLAQRRQIAHSSGGGGNLLTGLGNYSNLLSSMGGQLNLNHFQGNAGNLERLLQHRNELLAQGAQVPQVLEHVHSQALQQQQQQMPQPALSSIGPASALVQQRPQDIESTFELSETKKRELDKAPGSVIVPCRARGMPMDHNFKTAYFVIPENVKHGDELICSYFACRNAGIKFRYCSHCKVPVAKRNFRKRHKHGGQDVRGGGDSDDDNSNDDIPHHITASNRGEEEDADGISSQSAGSNNQESPIDDVNRGLVRESMQNLKEQSRLSNLGEKRQKEGMSSGVASKISEDRKKQWAALLAKRPATTEGDLMSTWLMEVLAVSDLETPIKIVAEDGQVAEAEADGLAKKVDTEEPTPGVALAAGAPVAPINSAVFTNEFVKRSIDNSGLYDTALDENYATGSFAEWKERKRQKKQSNSDNGSDNSKTAAV